MGKTISNSVGAWEKGAKNLHQDIITVQTLLKAAADELEHPAYDPNGIDGKISKTPGKSDTVKAIHAFQASFMQHPDELIEPGKTTITKLAAYMPDQPGHVPGNVPANPIADVNSYYFPLGFVPRLSYHTGGRRFGANRSHGTRKHAACDLIASEGTKIYAIHDGTVIRGPYHFYRGTYAIEVDHGDLIARYCEIKSTAPGVRVGTEVNAGQLIAFVGKMYHDSMLHFELYSGTASGALTQRSNPPYQRRSDLLNPTPYLEMWESRLPG